MSFGINSYGKLLISLSIQNFRMNLREYFSLQFITLKFLELVTIISFKYYKSQESIKNIFQITKLEITPMIRSSVKTFIAIGIVGYVSGVKIHHL
jgi:hypothetical protein